MPEARNQADPEQGDREQVRQELAVDVDAGQGDQVSREYKGQRRREPEPEMPGSRREGEGGSQLDERVTR